MEGEKSVVAVGCGVDSGVGMGCGVESDGSVNGVQTNVVTGK